jgi:hypothetical protein
MLGAPNTNGTLMMCHQTGLAPICRHFVDNQPESGINKLGASPFCCGISAAPFKPEEQLLKGPFHQGGPACKGCA